MTSGDTRSRSGRWPSPLAEVAPELAAIPAGTHAAPVSYELEEVGGRPYGSPCETRRGWQPASTSRQSSRLQPLRCAEHRGSRPQAAGRLAIAAWAPRSRRNLSDAALACSMGDSWVQPTCSASDLHILRRYNVLGRDEAPGKGCPLNCHRG